MSWATYFCVRPLPCSVLFLCISTVKVLAPREQAILFSHRWASSQQPTGLPHLPPTPHNYLRPSVYTVQQQILSNNSSQLTNSLISHLCRPVCSAIALDEEQLLNILAVGWLVSQWTTVILLNYILLPSAENRSILQCCPVSDEK